MPLRVLRHLLTKAAIELSSMERRAHWSHGSLRRTLLLVLVPGLLAVLGLDIVVNWRNTVAGANAAFDRSLLGAVKAMDANISTARGGLSVELPYRMLEFFELTASGQVFYRVASDDNLWKSETTVCRRRRCRWWTGSPSFMTVTILGCPCAWARIRARSDARFRRARTPIAC